MTTGRKVVLVVDTHSHLQGVVTRSDLLQVLLEEG